MPHTMFDLSGRVALITGAGRGMGLGVARTLGRLGAKVAVNDYFADRAQAAAQGLLAEGLQAVAVPGDITRPEVREAVVAATRSAFGDVDLLINNAGAGRLGRFLDSPADTEQQTVLLNVVAVVDLTRRLLPGMLARAQETHRRAGLIVVASTAAFAAVPMFATYAASKAFDLQFTEALAEELRDEPIDVVALCPGATRTNFGARAGWRSSGLPGAADPGDVAADALDSLGRETVCVPGRLREVALTPVVMPRRLLTGALGLAMRFVAGK